MAILITRSFVVPVWLLACALIVVFAAPSGMVSTGLLLSSGLAAAAILLFGRGAVHPSTAEGPPIIDVRPLHVKAVRPRWPNSGFRNIGRGTKHG